MAALVSELQIFLDQELKSKTIKDYAPNGLQIEGGKSCQRLAVAVTASRAVIEQAIAVGAQVLLVHHGLFWQGQSPCLAGAQRERVALLLKANITLLAYHLPLDVHLQWGNNAQLAKHLDIEVIAQHSVDGVNGLLWQGRLAEPVDPETLIQQWQPRLLRQPVLLGDKKRQIQNLAWCTGGAQKYFQQAIELGVDAYISGEVSEPQYHLAHETGVRFLACGHHATERYGVLALGQVLADQFGLQWQFIDENNPV